MRAAQNQMAATAVEAGAPGEFCLVGTMIVLVRVAEFRIAFEAFEILVEYKVDDTRDSVRTPGRRGAAGYQLPY